MSVAATSLETDCEQLDSVLYSIDFTGAPLGNLSVQISNDKSTWRTIPIDPSINLTGAGGSCFIDVKSINWKYIRLSWSPLGGSVGNLNAYYKAHSRSA